MRYRQILEACWKGYTQKGMKPKGSRMVPNCVKTTEDVAVDEMARFSGDTMLKFNKFALPELKKFGFRGPYKLEDYPRLEKLFKNDDGSWYNYEFQGSYIMLKGNNVNNFEWVMIPTMPDYGDEGYAYGGSYGYTGGLTLKQLIKSVSKDHPKLDPPRGKYDSPTAHQHRWELEYQKKMEKEKKKNLPQSLSEQELEEDLRKWFKEKWVRFGPDGKIRGPCARGSKKEGKPKCLPQKKAHSLGKKKRASAAAKKRREDPNPNRRGSAKNVATKTNRDK